MNQKLKEQAHKEFEEKKLVTGAMWLVKMWEKNKNNTEIEIELPEHIKDEFRYFIDSLIDKTVQTERERIVEELALLRLAYEELLELRGFLTQAGEYDPNYDRLEEYWKSGKPEWEKKLNNITK